MSSYILMTEEMTLRQRCVFELFGILFAEPAGKYQVVWAVCYLEYYGVI